MIRRLILSFAAAALALSLTQCGSAFEPREVAGIFVVQSIDGDPLPAVWVQGEWGRQEVVADTFFLFADGTGVEHVVRRNVPALPGEPSPARSEAPFHYTLGADGAIQIGYECRDVIIYSASCIAPPHLVGEVTADGMRLIWVVGQGQVLELRRLE